MKKELLENIKPKLEAFTEKEADPDKGEDDLIFAQLDVDQALGAMKVLGEFETQLDPMNGEPIYDLKAVVSSIEKNALPHFAGDGDFRASLTRVKAYFE